MHQSKKASPKNETYSTGAGRYSRKLTKRKVRNGAIMPVFAAACRYNLSQRFLSG